MSGGAAYSLYDVLRTLIERVGWQTEAEKIRCLDSINKAEEVQIFGNMAKIIACSHELPTAPDGYFSGALVGNKCKHCGKIM